MATSSTVPMIDKNGNGALIPSEQMENALRDPDAGFRVGFHLIDKNGNHAIIPADRLHDALQDQEAGFKIFQAPQTPTQFEQDRTHNFGLSAAGHLAKEAAMIPVGIAGAVGNAMDPMAPAKMAGDIATADTMRAVEGRSVPYRVAAGVGGMLGVNATGMEEAADRNDPGAIVGTAAADMGAAALAPKVMEKFKAAAELRNAGKVIDAPAAAKKLTDAINPSPEDMPKFESTLTRHIGRIAKAAEENGIDLKTGGRAELVEATRKASADHQELYNKQLLDPIKDRRIAASEPTTYGDAEQRLRHLNDLINYDEGLSAEGETQLQRKAEANQLRDMLNKNMGRELGVEPEQIQEARKTGEELRSLANKSELAMNMERYAANAQERGNTANVHATPHGAYLTTGGRVGRMVNRAMEGVLGHPGDNVVREVFGNLKVEPPRNAVPNIAAADRANAELANTGRPSADLALSPQQKRAVAGAVANRVIRQGEDNFAYRVRDVGEEGVPLRNTHSQATTSIDEAHKYVESRGNVQGKPQEVVRVNLDKLGKGDYELVKGPSGSQWVRFSKALPESAVEPVSRTDTRGASSTMAEQLKAKLESRKQGNATRQKQATESRAADQARRERNFASHGRNRTEAAAAEGLGQ